MLPRVRLLGTAAALALALPALAQDRPESILPPGFGDPPPTQQPSPPPTPTTTPTPTPSPAPSIQPGGEVIESGLSGLTASEAADAMVVAVAPQIELPSYARRDPSIVGPLPAVDTGFTDRPWGAASGKFLSVLMRRIDAPLASRWGHILLRNAVLTRAAAPSDVNPVDWVAERAWLLVRMGEADGARMLVAGVDVGDFTPKMFQVATQSALANADPAALCPLEDGLRKVERTIAPLTRAMCASLSGNGAVAAADIEAARRRGRHEAIDLALADKVVGAGADTSRAATIEWEPVKRLNAWRFGLATATGMAPPAALMDAATPQVRAWQARAPLLSAEQRIDSARIAAGLGVFSSQALVDLYSEIYDLTDPSDLGETDAWQVRLAFAARERDDRIAAMRKLLDGAEGPVEREAVRALLSRAAARIAPDEALQDIAPELISAMFAGGLDREAARWAAVVGRMDNAPGDRAWAMLALGAPVSGGLNLSRGRIEAFIDRDDSGDKQRSALLVAGLAGLGRIDSGLAGQLSQRHGMGLGKPTSWTRMIDGASLRRQPGTVALLAAVGLQGRGFDGVQGFYLYHLTTALNRNGQGFAARMIAAEALSRT